MHQIFFRSLDRETRKSFVECRLRLSVVRRCRCCTAPQWQDATVVCQRKADGQIPPPISSLRCGAGGSCEESWLLVISFKKALLDVWVGTLRCWLQGPGSVARGCRHIHTYTRIHIYTITNTRIQDAYANTHIHIHIYTYTYTHTHIYTYTRTRAEFLSQ